MREMDHVIVRLDSTERLVVKSVPPVVLVSTVCNSANVKTEQYVTPKTEHVNAPQAGVGRNVTKHVLQEHSGRIVRENVTVLMECIVIHQMASAFVHREKKDTNVKRHVKMGCSVQVVREFVPVRMAVFVILSQDLVSVSQDGGGRNVIDHVRMEDLERDVMRYVIVQRQTTPPSTIHSLLVVTMSPENADALLAGPVRTVKHLAHWDDMVKDAVILVNVQMEHLVIVSQDSVIVHLDSWERIVKVNVRMGYGDRIV